MDHFDWKMFTWAEPFHLRLDRIRKRNKNAVFTRSLSSTLLIYDPDSGENKTLRFTLLQRKINNITNTFYLRYILCSCTFSKQSEMMIVTSSRPPLGPTR